MRFPINLQSELGILQIQFSYARAPNHGQNLEETISHSVQPSPTINSFYQCSNRRLDKSRVAQAIKLQKLHQHILRMAFITKEQLKNLFQVIEKVVGVGEFKCYSIGTFKAKMLNVYSGRCGQLQQLVLKHQGQGFGLGLGLASKTDRNKKLNSHSKSPNWQEASQFAIQKHDQVVEIGSSEKQLQPISQSGT